MSGVGVAGVLSPIDKIQPASFLLAKRLANCIPLSSLTTRDGTDISHCQCCPKVSLGNDTCMGSIGHFNSTERGSTENLSTFTGGGDLQFHYPSTYLTPTAICFEVLYMHKSRFTGIVYCTIALLMCTAAQEQHPQHIWDYGDALGPNHWGDLKPEFAPCKTGHHQ